MKSTKLTHLKTKIQEVLKLEATPKKVAMGVAIGVFWNFIPSIGVGPFLSAFFAKAFKGSIVAAVTMNLATGIFIPFLYTLNIVTGKYFVGQRFTHLKLSDYILRVFGETVTFMEGLVGERTIRLLVEGLEIFSVGFFVGSILNAIGSALLLYTVFYYTLIFGKHRRQGVQVSTDTGGKTILTDLPAAESPLAQSEPIKQEIINSRRVVTPPVRGTIDQLDLNKVDSNSSLKNL